jgi:integrase
MAGNRGRRGGGTVFYDEDRGRYVGQVSYLDDAGKRHRPKVYARTAEECWEKLDELRAEKKAGGQVAPRDYTVEMAVNDLMAHPPAKWKSPVTLRVQQGHAGRIVAKLGKVKLHRLTAAQVDRLLEDMAAGGYATDTIGRTRSLLRLAIRRAQRNRLVTENAADLADVPAGTRRESRSMKLDQVRVLLGLKLTTWWRAYITVALMCGLRPGELLGLRWEDVDFKAGVIRVRKCLKPLPDPLGGKLRLVLADLKTERSRRTIRMPAQVQAVLLALRKEQAAARLQLGPEYDVRGLSIVFGGAAGAPRWPQDIGEQFKVLCGRAGIGADWTPREQRHTFVSVLSDSGVSIEDIADAVGHINSTVTKVVYRHQIADETTAAATVMDSIFGEASSS